MVRRCELEAPLGRIGLLTRRRRRAPRRERWCCYPAEPLDRPDFGLFHRAMSAFLVTGLLGANLHDRFREVLECCLRETLAL